MLDETFNFAARLKAIRTARGMTQRNLGEAMGIDANVISNWEMGIRRPGNLATLRTLCVALGCSADALLGLEPLELTAEEHHLLGRIRRLNAAGRYMVNVVLDAQEVLAGADPDPLAEL